MTQLNQRLTEEQKQAFGLTSSHLLDVEHEGRVFKVHESMLLDFQKLQSEAKSAGFDLQLVSAFRSFDRQKNIFESKVRGDRVLLDDLGKPLDFSSLSDNEKLNAICRWSALPGASRHHWGSDIDIYDANSIKLADVELVPDEVNGNGPCAAMHDWLSDQIAANRSFGFYRPYEYDCGGVAPERWHISYAPVSRRYERIVKKEVLLALFEQENLCFLAQVKPNFESIFSKFVKISSKNCPNWVLAL